MGLLDKNFFIQICTDYQQLLFKKSNEILQNVTDAEDAVQEAFIRIEKNLDQIHNLPDDIRAIYCVNIVKNISLDMLRKKKRRHTANMDDFCSVADSLSIEETVVEKCTVDEIKKAMRKLAEKDYELLYLYLFKELQPIEIAEIMHISSENVRVSIHRAKKKLVVILNEEGITL